MRIAAFVMLIISIIAFGISTLGVIITIDEIASDIKEIKEKLKIK
jgi:hypothetical protein